jgi:hypothetical protein
VSADEPALLKELATVFAHSAVERLLKNARWAPFAVVRTRQIGTRQIVELAFKKEARQ